MKWAASNDTVQIGPRQQGMVNILIRVTAPKAHEHGVNQVNSTKTPTNMQCCTVFLLEISFQEDAEEQSMGQYLKIPTSPLAGPALTISTTSDETISGPGFPPPTHHLLPPAPTPEPVRFLVSPSWSTMSPVHLALRDKQNLPPAGPNASTISNRWHGPHICPMDNSSESWQQVIKGTNCLLPAIRNSRLNVRAEFKQKDTWWQSY